MLRLQPSTSIWWTSWSHPNQNWLEQAIFLREVQSQRDWCFQGRIKSRSGWAYWSDGVSVLIQLLCFQDSASTAVPWCSPTAAPWARELSVGPLTLCSYLYGVFAGFTGSSCVSPTTPKNLSCLNNFSLAVHQIPFGGRPAQTSLVTWIHRNAVLFVHRH